jgi:hypothetical protein
LSSNIKEICTGCGTTWAILTIDFAATAPVLLYWDTVKKTLMIILKKSLIFVTGFEI